uniref:Uncharacterized protein n=1 Tax=Tanacetum cinerariifolium TaxID=118510 RepID=A0A6L2LEX1_TANCI|nr:hypothetical protein [Tanacetum cinerariifolium]
MKSTPAKQAKPAIAKQSKLKPVKENSTKPTPLQKADKGKVTKAQNVKSSLQLVDEPDEEQDQPEHLPEPQDYSGVAIREPVAKATRPLPVVEGKGKAITTKEQAAQSLLAPHTPKRRSTTDQFILQRQTPATEEASTRTSTQPQDDTSTNIVYETPSSADAEIGEYVDNKVNLEERTAELDEGQAGSDPGKTLESRPPPDDDKMDEDQVGSDPVKSHVALAGPNPEPMHDDYVAIVYPKVHESLKFPADEQVILEDPLNSSGTLSSTKILDDTYTFWDQFFNDKSTEDEPKKLNVDAKVISLVNVPIHQASTSVPPLSTPIIDLSPQKPVASPLLKPFIAATT